LAHLPLTLQWSLPIFELVPSSWVIRKIGYAALPTIDTLQSTINKNNHICSYHRPSHQKHTEKLLSSWRQINFLKILMFAEIYTLPLATREFFSLRWQAHSAHFVKICLLNDYAWITIACKQKSIPWRKWYFGHKSNNHTGFFLKVSSILCMQSVFLWLSQFVKSFFFEYLVVKVAAGWHHSLECRYCARANKYYYKNHVALIGQQGSTGHTYSLWVHRRVGIQKSSSWTEEKRNNFLLQTFIFWV
jgi:hypothetical protein